MIDLTRVTLLQQNLVTLEDTLAQAQGEIATGLIQVYRAFGGGWQIRLNGCDPGALPSTERIGHAGDDADGTHPHAPAVTPASTAADVPAYDEPLVDGY